MKELLCQEFCNQIQVHAVPAGLAIGTSHIGLTGDPIGFYVVGPNANGNFRIEDSGTTMPILDSCGADLAIESRASLFRELLAQYDVEYDDDRGELKTRSLTESEIPKAALRFFAFLLRVQDLTFLTQERAENTFKQEAIRDLRSEIGQLATITLDDVVSDAIADFKADIVVRAQGRAAVAVFLVRSDAKLYESMVLQSEAQYKAKVECRIIALMEDDSSVTKKAFSQALNRVIPLKYRGEEQSAIQRIAYEAVGLYSTSAQ